MINLKLKSDCKFSSCSHLGIFYAVVDVYQNRGSAKGSIRFGSRKKNN